MSRGSDTSAADLVDRSMLASIIVSERVPAIGSSSRLSMPSSRMLTRLGALPVRQDVLDHRRRCCVVIVRLRLARRRRRRLAGCCGTGTLTVTGHRATVTTLGGGPAVAASTRRQSAPVADEHDAECDAAQDERPERGDGKEWRAEQPGPGTLIDESAQAHGRTRPIIGSGRAATQPEPAAHRERDRASICLADDFGRHVVAHAAGADALGQHPALAAAGPLLVERQTPEDVLDGSAGQRSGRSQRVAAARSGGWRRRRRACPAAGDVAAACMPTATASPCSSVP